MTNTIDIITADDLVVDASELAFDNLLHKMSRPIPGDSLIDCEVSHCGTYENAPGVYLEAGSVWVEITLPNVVAMTRGESRCFLKWGRNVDLGDGTSDDALVAARALTDAAAVVQEVQNFLVKSFDDIAGN